MSVLTFAVFSPVAVARASEDSTPIARASDSVGGADTIFTYGNPGDIAVVGDWDGNGSDTPGVVRSGRWYLNNQQDASAPDRVFTYGNPGDIAVVGDWDGNGSDTPGVVRSGRWYLNNQQDPSAPDRAFAYGNPGDIAVVGDWDGNRSDTPGVVRSGRWYLNNQQDGAAPPAAPAPAPAPVAAGFPNPVFPPPNKDRSYDDRYAVHDPGLLVQKFGGINVYFAASGARDAAGNMPIWSSGDRRTWVVRGWLRRPKWLARGGSPQIYSFPGRYVAYFGAVVKGREKEKRCVGRAESSVLTDFTDEIDIRGAYLCEPRKKYSVIDPSIFKDINGQLYLLYKDDLSAADKRKKSRLVIRTIGPSGSLAQANLGPPSHPLTAAGDREEGRSVEAPTLIRNPTDGLYYLFYSSGNYALDTYGVRVARAAKPTGPYTRSPYNPVLQAYDPVRQRDNDPKFCGSGHQDITYTPEEGWLIFYHAYLAQSGTTCSPPRYFMMDQLRWDRPGGWPRVHDGTPSE